MDIREKTTRTLLQMARNGEAWAVECTRCSARIGQPCVYTIMFGKIGDPMRRCHGERLDLFGARRGRSDASPDGEGRRPRLSPTERNRRRKMASTPTPPSGQEEDS